MIKLNEEGIEKLQKGLKKRDSGLSCVLCLKPPESRDQPFRIHKVLKQQLSFYAIILLSILGGTSAWSALICDIGIADFTTITRNPELADYTQAIPTLIFTQLANSQRLSLVNRRDLDKVLDEMGLAEMGVVDPKTAAEVGRAVGAKYMFIGQLSGFQGKSGTRIRITTQLIHVESGYMIGGWEVAASPTELDVKAIELARSILARLFPVSPNGAASRSLLIPGWGQCANKRANNSKSGYVFFPLTIMALGGLSLTQYVYAKADDEYIEIKGRDYKTYRELRDAEEKRDDRAQMRLIAAGTVAAIWLANIVDAFMEARELDKYRLRAETNARMQALADPQSVQVIWMARF